MTIGTRSLCRRVWPSQTFWALSIQFMFRFEISEIPCAQWNGTFWLHRPNPSHCVFGYCSCKEDTKEWYWGQQVCPMERDISVRSTEITRPVKVDHLKSWSRIFQSDQAEMVHSILMYQPEISGIFGWMESALCLLLVTYMTALSSPTRFNTSSLQTLSDQEMLKTFL